MLCGAHLQGLVCWWHLIWVMRIQHLNELTLQDCMDYAQTVSSSSKLQHNHFNEAPDAGTCNLVYNHEVELLYGVILTGNWLIGLDVRLQSPSWAVKWAATASQRLEIILEIILGYNDESSWHWWHTSIARRHCCQYIKATLSMIEAVGVVEVHTYYNVSILRK